MTYDYDRHDERYMKILPPSVLHFKNLILI